MEKVLLAIDGMMPDKQIVVYAAKLCQRIKAELNILHIIDPHVYAGYLKNFQRQVRRARDVFENSMMAATFAETGEHDTAKSLLDKASAQISRMLSESDKEAVKYRVQVRPGNTSQEIINHVKKNRDIVLAIYDDAIARKIVNPTDDQGHCGHIRKTAKTGRTHKINASALQKELSVPLVIRRFLTIEQS